jgi:hypothetical protein
LTWINDDQRQVGKSSSGETCWPGVLKMGEALDVIGDLGSPVPMKNFDRRPFKSGGQM